MAAKKDTLKIKLILSIAFVIMFFSGSNLFAEPYEKGFKEFEKLKWGQNSDEWEKQNLLPFSIVDNRKFYKLKKLEESFESLGIKEIYFDYKDDKLDGIVMLISKKENYKKVCKILDGQFGKSTANLNIGKDYFIWRSEESVFSIDYYANTNQSLLLIAPVNQEIKYKYLDLSERNFNRRLYSKDSINIEVGGVKFNEIIDKNFFVEVMLPPKPSDNNVKTYFRKDNNYVMEGVKAEEIIYFTYNEQISGISIIFKQENYEQYHSILEKKYGAPVFSTQKNTYWLSKTGTILTQTDGEHGFFMYTRIRFPYNLVQDNYLEKGAWWKSFTF